MVACQSRSTGQLTPAAMGKVEKALSSIAMARPHNRAVELRQLRSFIRVVELGSISRAAQELGQAQASHKSYSRAND
jgi:hypothetical protein